MSNETVRTGQDLETAVTRTTQLLLTATAEAVKKATDKTAKEVINQTSGKSPRRTGVYAKGWKSKKSESGTGVYGRVVYQKEKPGLTHLLQDGHEIKGAAYFRKNRTHTDAVPHITTDEETEKIFEGILLEEIDREMGKE